MCGPRHWRRTAQPEELQRSLGTFAWRHIDVSEMARDDEAVVANESSSSGLDSRLARSGQGNVAGASMASISRPLCFAMTYYEHSRSRHDGQIT
jgi:hypothetical protein